MGLLAALLLAAPALFLTAFVFSALGSDVATRAAAERSRAVDLAARLIDNRLATASAEVSAIAARPSLRSGLRARDTIAVAAALRDLRGLSSGYTAAVALDPKGLFIVGDPEGPAGRDFSARDYFIGAMASTRPYVSAAFATAGGDAPVAVAVALAVREGPETLGLILVGLSPQLVIASLDPLDKIPGREVLIVDKASRVVSSTDPTRAPLGVVAFPGLDVATSAASGAIRSTVGGSDRVITFARAAAPTWTLLVIDDPAVLLALERRLADSIAAAAAVAVAVAAIAGILLSRMYLVLRRQRDVLVASQSMLAAASAAADLASKEKSTFLANMSHELRTPLNAVLGFSDLLAEQLHPVMNDRQRRHLANIKQAGQHLLDLINDVLDLAKVEAGRIDLRPEVSTVGAIVGPVAETTETLARARGLGFAAHLDDARQIFADVARLRQILLNLLSNAVKFTEPGGRVTLVVRAAGEHLEIEVADTGIGIPAAKQDRLFGTFERLHEGVSQAPGTGLGLALTRRLVELHGGTISFASTEGQGTTFHVSLPGVIAAAGAPDRILVVEDERGDAELIVALAAAQGLLSETVPTAAAALASLRAGSPLGVVLDLRLPDGRGEEVLRAMRTDPATARIPVIVVTVEDDEGASRALGADDHLTKPIDRARLAAWLGRVGRRARAVEGSSATAAGR